MTVLYSSEKQKKTWGLNGFLYFTFVYDLLNFFDSGTRITDGSFEDEMCVSDVHVLILVFMIEFVDSCLSCTCT